MPGWNEASVDELLSDSIVRDLMAADGVDPAELRALLYGVQRTIECYATRQGGPTSLAGFARLCSATRAEPARPQLPAKSRPIRRSENPNSSCRFATIDGAALVHVVPRNRCTARS
jgi:hypothetical protein